MAQQQPRQPRRPHVPGNNPARASPRPTDQPWRAEPDQVAQPHQAQPHQAQPHQAQPHQAQPHQAQRGGRGRGSWSASRNPRPPLRDSVPARDNAPPEIGHPFRSTPRYQPSGAARAPAEPCKSFSENFWCAFGSGCSGTHNAVVPSQLPASAIHHFRNLLPKVEELCGHVARAFDSVNEPFLSRYASDQRGYYGPLWKALASARFFQDRECDIILERMCNSPSRWFLMLLHKYADPDMALQYPAIYGPVLMDATPEPSLCDFIVFLEFASRRTSAIPQLLTQPLMVKLQTRVDRSATSPTASELRASFQRLKEVLETRVQIGAAPPVATGESRGEAALRRHKARENPSLLPSAEEILGEDMWRLTANIVDEPWPMFEGSLDIYRLIHFELLRAELVHPLREGILKIVNPRAARGSSLTLYHDVGLVDLEVPRDKRSRARDSKERGVTRPTLIFSFKSRRRRDIAFWRLGRHLKYGSLVILFQRTPQGDLVRESIVFCTVAESSAELLVSGRVGLIVLSDQWRNFVFSGVYEMVESPVYFGAYQPVLEWLLDKQKFEQNPLVPQFVYSQPCRIPQYLNGRPLNLSAIMRPGSTHQSTVTHGRWPPLSEVVFDESQYEAFKHIMSNSVSLVQGPPGTGKSFVGVKTVAVLRQLLHPVAPAPEMGFRRPMQRVEHGEGPIFVICMTNHALDDFLTSLLEFCPKLVRLGSRSKSEALKDRTLAAAFPPRTRGQEFFAHLDQCNEKGKEIDALFQFWRSVKNRDLGMLLASFPPAYLPVLRQPPVAPSGAGGKTPLKKNGRYGDRFLVSAWINNSEPFYSAEEIPKPQPVPQTNRYAVLDQDAGAPQPGPAVLAAIPIVLNQAQPAHGTAAAPVHDTAAAPAHDTAAAPAHDTAAAPAHDTAAAAAAPAHDTAAAPAHDTAAAPAHDTAAAPAHDTAAAPAHDTAAAPAHDTAAAPVPEAAGGEWTQVGAGGRPMAAAGAAAAAAPQQTDLVDELEALHLDGEDDFADVQFDDDANVPSEEPVIDLHAEAAAAGFAPIFGGDEALGDTNQSVYYLQQRYCEILAEHLEARHCTPNRFWLMPGHQRLALIQQVQDQMLDIVEEALAALLNQSLIDTELGANMWWVNALRAVPVIGATATFAAQNRRVLSHLHPRVVMVEEAGELIESQLLACLSSPRLEHLIMIGDHKQLRPKVNDYELCRKYHLDVSLMERLIRTGSAHSTLRTQLRMRPEISVFSRVFYDRLEDHERVHRYPHVRGMSNDVFFVTHTMPENQKDESLNSHSNVHEAKFIAATALYLLQQKYEPESLVIITPYMGQFRLLRNEVQSLAKDPRASHFASELKRVRITTIDDFQGEEADVVVLSLVRSNTEKRLGFLSIQNRIIVAISRARHGMIIVGNGQCAESGSEDWRNIIQIFRQRHQYGTQLRLSCSNHPQGPGAFVSQAEDYQHVRVGGCREPCQARLNCGHSCRLQCHPFDHDRVQCFEICGRERSCGHKCQKTCVNCTRGCPAKCNEIVAYTHPVCGHQFNINCHQLSGPIECRTPVNVTHACGHTEQVKCFEMRAGRLMCRQPCPDLLPCGNSCSKTCKGNRPAHPHVRAECQVKCDSLLMCGHSCEAGCKAEKNHTVSCEKPCEFGCLHQTKCLKRCHEACVPCREPCKWSCKHFKCSRLCFEPCDRPRCEQPCLQKLQCGHVCVGLCGEPHPRCPKCLTNKDYKCSLSLTPIRDLEYEKGARLYGLPCNCAFELEMFDQYIATENEKESVQLLCCPNCRRAIFSAPRYEAEIKERIRKLEIVKQRLSATITAAARREIREAMGAAQGHWFVCPNGHPYYIGECGGAMESRTCPEVGCGSVIGGANHRVAEGNRLYTEIDGATAPAYPNQPM
eukprot:TRINITY_DN2617_c0_g1_i6.p1 TRINITY_DN2617_c0_g1~~TRINITY_DN2617_c0_g1_i6.p1  ORF type:complete len:1886 (-),score=285.95 TRINITY_DN2617_c0_g1_i6:16-5643(-)